MDSIQRLVNGADQNPLTDVLDFFEVVVVSPQIYEVLSSFVKLFGHPPSHDYFFFDCEVLKSLRYERQLPQGRLAYRAWCWTEREQSVDARFTPAIFRVFSKRFAGEIGEG